MSPQTTRHVLTCIECGVRSASPIDFGWKAYRVDDPEREEPPTLALYCPTCALAEFGSPPPRRYRRRHSD